MGPPAALLELPQRGSSSPPPSSQACRGPDGSPHPFPIIPPCPLHTQHCNQSSKGRVLKNISQIKLLLFFLLAKIFYRQMTKKFYAKVYT